MKNELQGRFEARLERFPPWTRLLLTPVLYTLAVWKMQLVFTAAGGLVFFGHYARLRAGHTPEFAWKHWLAVALIPAFIIPLISIVIVGVSIGLSIYRARHRDKSP